MQSDSPKHSKNDQQPEAPNTGTSGTQKIDEGLQERGTLEDWERGAATEPQPDETEGNPERGTREDWERSAVVEPQTGQAMETQLRGTREDWERSAKEDEATKTPSGSPSLATGSAADDTTPRKEQVTSRDGRPRD